MCKIANLQNLIHFNKDNYSCYCCHEHQGVGGPAVQILCLVHVNSKINI